jgi:hypothetical protein
MDREKLNRHIQIQMHRQTDQYTKRQAEWLTNPSDMQNVLFRNRQGGRQTKLTGVNASRPYNRVNEEELKQCEVFVMLNLNRF